MERRKIHDGTAVRSAVRHARGSVVGLGLLGALLAGQGSAAQAPPTADPPAPGRLTVRPREMATGTKTSMAGEQLLDSLRNYRVYVPKRCVGTRRCPLVVTLAGAGYGAKRIVELHAQHAEKYGMILLAPQQDSPYQWDLLNAWVAREFNKDSSGLKTDPNDPWIVHELRDTPDVKKIDAAMKQVLRKFAIDPDKIALIGVSQGGDYSLFLGSSNLDVFSRIGPMSTARPFRGVGPQNKATQFLLAAGTEEPPYLSATLIAMRAVQEAGNPLKQVLSLKGHENRVEEHDFVWRWLQESWAKPNPADRPLPRADSLVTLTTEMLTKTSTFWASFMMEPESIRTTARLAHLKEVIVFLGQTPMSLLMADIPKLATKYPSVAAALTKAGLTAEQHQTYRIAIVSARATAELEKQLELEEQAKTKTKPVDATKTKLVDTTSTAGKNVEFIKGTRDDQQSEAFKAAWKAFATPRINTSMWLTP